MTLTKDRVLIARLPVKPFSPNGIVLPVLPDHLDDKCQWRILAVGPGKTVVNRRTKVKTLVPMEVQPGDRVLVDMTAGHLFDFPDGRRIIVESQIMAKW